MKHNMKTNNGKTKVKYASKRSKSRQAGEMMMMKKKNKTINKYLHQKGV